MLFLRGGPRLGARACTSSSMSYIRHNVYKYHFAARIVKNVGQKSITRIWGRSRQRKKRGIWQRKLHDPILNLT